MIVLSLLLLTNGFNTLPDPPSAEDLLPLVEERIEEVFISPLPPSTYRFSSEFGLRWGRAHQGVDLSAPIGTPILASKSGKVIKSGWMNGYGNTVIIQHEDGSTTLYAHMSSTGVRLNTYIPQGRCIGWVGSTGRSSGPHLHFEIRRAEGAVNPRIYIQF